MRQIDVYNPFGGPVYHEETVGSTMDVSRTIAGSGAPHGAVITADYQEKGRGRTRGRVWNTERGENLLFTILLRYPRIEDIPAALTLRAGLAVSLAIEDFAPPLAGKTLIKWPNDIMLLVGAGIDLPGVGALGANAPVKKAAGIFADADGGSVHIGIGVNMAQKQFPGPLRGKATSIGIAAGMEFASADRFVLLEKILARLHAEFAAENSRGWKEKIESRLYKKGEQVSFAAGVADDNGSGKIVTGILAGIGSQGELLLKDENGVNAFVTGELVMA